MNIEKLLRQKNIADVLSDKRLDEIASDCIEGFKDDKASRSEWEDRMEQALNLALQVMQKKNSPWPGASNVKFPLLTIASLQFNARIFPSLISGSDIVKCKAVGPDPASQKSDRAMRVSNHMSYQLMEEDNDWEEEFDKLLMSIPILGCAFKKTYFDPSKGHNISENVFPKDLVIDYYAKSIEDADRLTQVLTMPGRVMTEHKRLELYLNIDLEDPQIDDDRRQEDERQGLTTNTNNIPHTLYEQHCYIDLDDDDYPEPYLVTLDRDSEKVLRIVPRYSDESIIYNDKDQVAKIDPVHYFTKYTFIPAPDGGIYDLGFGALLGPINESINTTINQLIDAGTLNNLNPGMISRGLRLKGGNYRFKPGEMKQVNATGDDLRKGIFMLPIKEPSGTLFSLLNVLIEYGERISSVSDMMVGKTPGQNTPATTSMAALEQGQKVFTAIHKRMYRGLTTEIRKLYKLNGEYLNPETYYQYLDTDDKKVFQQDYLGDPTDIRPSADPADASDTKRIEKAQMLLQLSQSGPGYNLYNVQKEVLRAYKIQNIEEFLPDPKGPDAIPPPRDIEAETEQAKAQAEIQYKMVKLDAEIDLMKMQALKLETAAQLDLAKAESEEVGPQLEIYKNQLAEMKENREMLKMRQDAMQKQEELNEQRRVSNMAGQSRNPGGA